MFNLGSTICTSQCSFIMNPIFLIISNLRNYLFISSHLSIISIQNPREIARQRY